MVELPEFNRDALEVLRQPLEDGVVNVSRVQASYTYPADFCLIAAMNPCPCGYFGDVFRQCTCSSTQVQKYQKRISVPLLDRIDIQIEVPGLSDGLSRWPVGAVGGCNKGHYQHSCPQPPHHRNENTYAKDSAKSSLVFPH